MRWNYLMMLSKKNSPIKAIKDGRKNLGEVGLIKSIDRKKIMTSLKAGKIPIISPIGWTSKDEPMNINGDFAACSIAAIKALKKLNIKKVSIFTPYSKKLNDDVIDYFNSEGFEVTSNSYFDIQDDYDIGKVDQDYLYDVLSKIDLKGADALFVSCTALPVLEIIDRLEQKLNTIVLSSNQALIWDTLVKIKKNNSVEGFGKLFQVN